MENPPKREHISAISMLSNEDLLSEILLRLPPKSLLRFQCVSKQWLSIISHTDFRLLHSRRYRANNTSSPPSCKGLFFHRIGDRLIDFMPFRKDDANSMAAVASRFNALLTSLLDTNDFDLQIPIYLNHSCNGLLCIGTDFEYTATYVYNPTTNQHRLIPKPSSLESWRRTVTLNIVFDPSKPPHYKLVHIWLPDGTDLRHCFSIYSSETGVWRDTGATVNLYHNSRGAYYFRKGVLYNGDLYWVNDQNSISFDMEKERLNTKVCPFPTDGNPKRYFGECGGCLLAMRLEKDERKLEVLHFEKDYWRWIIKYYVDLGPLFSSYAPEFIRFSKRFQIHNFYLEKDGQLKLVISLKEKLISYDTDKQITEKVWNYHDKNSAELGLGIFTWPWGWIVGTHHIETLSSV